MAKTVNSRKRPCVWYFSQIKIKPVGMCLAPIMGELRPHPAFITFLDKQSPSFVGKYKRSRKANERQNLDQPINELVWAWTPSFGIHSV